MTGGGSGLGAGEQKGEFQFGHTKFELPIGSLGNDVKYP